MVANILAIAAIVCACLSLFYILKAQYHWNRYIKLVRQRNEREAQDAEPN